MTLNLGILVLFCILGVGACDDGDSDGMVDPDAGGVADAGPDAGGDAGVCESFPLEHSALLNAPTDATVVRKVPTHPPVQGGLP